MGEFDYDEGSHIIASNEPAQPKETIGFRLNHLMLRIKVPPDPLTTVDFIGSRTFYSFL
jgi:hypothetical protein